MINTDSLPALTVGGVLRVLTNSLAENGYGAAHFTQILHINGDHPGLLFRLNCGVVGFAGVHANGIAVRLVSAQPNRI